MYYDLIFTRCRQGIDILKGGRPITSDGYKVYACTPSLIKDANADLPFLSEAAKSKLPYSEGEFMDDAYLYLVPEKGDCFMQNFHPVPFDQNAEGDYAHRSGNYVNQIIVGNFSGFYPFELFRDNTVWYAKTREERYYYETPPTDLPPRTDISDPAGQIAIEEIGAFIRNGREEALMSAVSFLISQYALPVEERRFLVIRDDSEEKMELWIAAIELAFSPRISASLPFATRMNKFATANRYTVNQLGMFQAQINLQDKNQKLRYRAMIVGVDERDRTNASAARPLANSPFVLIDGKEKKAMFDADISNNYYQFITSFNEAHQSFCREFLQTINLSEPSPDIYRLLEIYHALCDNPSLPASKETADMLLFLGKYELLPSSRLKQIYAAITADLPRFLLEDLHSALQIINWLQSASLVLADSKASARLIDIVCKVFDEQVFRKLDPRKTQEFWQSIKDSKFALNVARHFVDPATLQANQSCLLRFTVDDKHTYVLIFLDCAAFSGAAEADDLKSIVNWGLQECYSHSDKKMAKEIIKTLKKNAGIDIQDVLLSIAKDAEKGYAEFVMMSLLEYDERIVANSDAILSFLNKLKACRMMHLYGTVLKLRAKTINATEINDIIHLLDRVVGLSDIDQADIYEILDQKLSLTEKNNLTIAKIISEKMPQGAACPKSAHLIALNALGDKKQRPRFTEIFSELIPRGFPSINNAHYIDMLVSALFKAKIDSRELRYIIRLFYREPLYINALVAAILDRTTSKEAKYWETLILVAAKTQDGNLAEALINKCANLRRGEKALKQLSDMLDRKEEAHEYFTNRIAPQSKEIINSQKSQSGLFAKFFSGDDKPKKRN